MNNQIINYATVKNNPDTEFAVLFEGQEGFIVDMDNDVDLHEPLYKVVFDTEDGFDGAWIYKSDLEKWRSVGIA